MEIVILEEDPLFWFKQHPQHAPFQADDILIYSFMTPHVPLIAAELAIIRNACGNRTPLLVCGGPHAGGDPQFALDLGFNLVFSGPGEKAFLEFGRQLLADPIDATPAIVRSTAAANWTRYVPVSAYFKRVPPLELMRGCYWHCRYCQTARLTPSFRTIAEVEPYLRAIVQRTFKRITFIAPSALEYGASAPRSVNLPLLEELLEYCHSLRIPMVEFGIFPSEMRPDCINDQVLALLAQYASNTCITLGAQSADDQRLSAVGRGHTFEQIRAACECAQRWHFRINLDIILAFPDESPDERRFSLSRLTDLCKHYPIHLQLHHFFPLAGSQFADRLPSFMNHAEHAILSAMRRNGIAKNWWQEGEDRVRNFFSWLQEHHPQRLAQYH